MKEIIVLFLVYIDEGDNLINGGLLLVLKVLKLYFILVVLNYLKFLVIWMDFFFRLL